jgi:adenine/guanine/hypoxanthine permease
MRNFFKFKEKGTNLSTEILGGLITFISMCYILPVNTSILSDMGMSASGVFIATALCSGIITIFMGLFANYPVVLSAGMGLNAFLTYTVSKALGYSWQECMILLTITGIIFFIMSLTPIRKKILESIPKDLKSIISAGLGGFIALVGLKGSGIITSNASTYVALGSLSDPSVIISIVAIFLAFFLYNLKTKHQMINRMAIPIAVVFAALTGLTINAISGFTNASLPSFSNSWGVNGFQDVFLYGIFSSDASINKDILGLAIDVISKPQTYAIIFSLIFVNLFDTTATLLAVNRKIPLFTKEGKISSNRTIMVDATGALICGPLGTSTVTSFVESTVGAEIGAKTGFASVVSGTLFLIAGFAFPLFSIFTASCVTAPALVCVGAMIFTGNLGEINWKDIPTAFAAFVTVLMVILTYSLTSGIGFGLIAYALMMIASKRAKEVNWVLYVIACFFLVSFTINEVVKFI